MHKSDKFDVFSIEGRVKDIALSGATDYFYSYKTEDNDATTTIAVMLASDPSSVYFYAYEPFNSNPFRLF